jgi:hypothetical protein
VTTMVDACHGRPACLDPDPLLLVTLEGENAVYARVAELADARDLGSRGQPWGFDSPLSHLEARHRSG